MATLQRPRGPKQILRIHDARGDATGHLLTGCSKDLWFRGRARTSMTPTVGFMYVRNVM